MKNMAKSVLSITILLVMSYFLSSNAEVNFLDQTCYESRGTFINNLNYRTNRDIALNRLTSLSSTSYFNTTTIGLGSSQVFALFSCRYDVSLDVCNQCVSNAVDKVTLACPLNVEAFMVYKECRLHYANRTIFAKEEDLPRLYIFSIHTIDDNGQFDDVLGSTVSGLISDVVLGFSDSNRYFGTSNGKYKSETIATLAQCNPDISSISCKGCLQNAFGNFTTNHTGALMGQIYAPTCLLTYKLSSFVDIGLNSPPSNSPSSVPVDNVPDVPFSFPTGKSPITPSGKSPTLVAAGSSIHRSIMAGVVGVILSLLLLI